MKLCEQTLIDHRITFHDHHEVDGLVKKWYKQWKKVYKNMNYRNDIRLIGTYSCHDWPWDINLVSKCPLRHSLLLFALWV
jgi:hypothetical protein